MRRSALLEGRAAAYLAIFGVLAAFILLTWLLSPSIGAQEGPLEGIGPPAGPFRPGEILVKFRPGASPQAILTAHDLRPLDEIPALGVKRLAVPPGREKAIIARLSREPGVLYAEPNGIVHIADTVPKDPYWDDQWNMQIISATKAWDIITGSVPITIAICDTGIDGTHLDLTGKMVAGWNVPDNTSIPPNTNSDDHGHGTHVAGIAAASTNNGFGVAGVSWGARLMPVKVLVNGSGTDYDVAQGIVWAVDHGAQVINLSLGGPEPSQTLQGATDYAYGRGALVIAAAGNCAQGGSSCGSEVNPIFYPAAYPNVIAVAATDSSDNTAVFSEYGYFIDLAAPGVDVWSTYPNPNNGYIVWTGTSMAAPHVAGLAALVWSANPAYSNAQVTYILTATADKVGPYPYINGWNEHYGYGRINAYSAAWLAALGLKVDKTGPFHVEAGEAITYALFVTNTGVITTGFILTDALPVGANFLWASHGGVLAGNTVSWTVPSLASGAAITRAFAITATGTIINKDYGTSHLEMPYCVQGSKQVVTLVGPTLFLPLVLRGYQAP